MNFKTYSIAVLFAAAGALMLQAENVRERKSFDNDWLFTYGNAASPAEDFGCGTEYFNYLTKANSVHNEGPYSLKFNPDSCGKEWKTVNLPHDWVVDLPFSKDASHSHGYKTVGYKFPLTSVGWYRKTFTVPAEDKGKHVWLEFDGIFRDARLWVNGFYLGNEPDGYASRAYDITEYLNYGGENVVAVRVDATLEQGWFYEGAGIYRHVWLNTADPMHVAPNGTFVYTDLQEPFDKATVNIEVDVVNSANAPKGYTLKHTLYDADGVVVAQAEAKGSTLQAKQRSKTQAVMHVADPHLWSVDDPYLYTVVTDVYSDGDVVDSYSTKTGLRHVRFDPDKGFFLNGKSLKLKGANMHQDHAGVGSGIPDALQAYRIRTLKDFGFNAYRSSHNPASPAMLDVCDSLGFLVIDENRLMGINDEHVRLLNNMIVRDRNHPSVILWSVGNEEWGIEWNEFGERLSESMREYVHRADPTRPMTVASSSGPTVLVPADVAGYNYILQNPVEEHRANYPERCAYGSEETSGCGTRGVYYPDPEGRWMVALNRHKTGRDSMYNAIERGWKFYDERPWLGGLFYWTGFDYRGEPNPMKYPATGSQFGIFDYCGFPKDEAYYLKAWWNPDEPMVHILPHWNLKGHEGENVDIWVYGNCDEVELIVNGKKMGRKPMPKNGHLSWQAVYRPGKVKAIGYNRGKKVAEQTVYTTDEASCIDLSADRRIINADGKDVSVVKVTLTDSKGRFVPDACNKLSIRVDGPARILGAGNGDSAFRVKERPDSRDAQEFEIDAFNGLAQILVQSTGAEGVAVLSVTSDGLKSQPLQIDLR